MKIIAFIFLFLIFSISAFSQVQETNQNQAKENEKKESKKQSEDQSAGSAVGSGRSGKPNPSAGSGIGDSLENIVRDKNAGVMILSKPQPRYTDRARENNTEGKVILEIEFKKVGKIGKIKIISGLPDGLNEKAVEAATQIRFLPELKDGKPNSVKKKVQFNFKLI